MTRYAIAVAAASFAASILIGCSSNKDQTKSETPASQVKPDDVAAERAKLSPEDRALVEAQEWCVVNTDERLGSMGEPLKLNIKGQPVFICCKGCKRKAESDPDATLAKVAELKAKAKSQKDAK